MANVDVPLLVAVGSLFLAVWLVGRSSATIGSSSGLHGALAGVSADYARLTG